LLSQASHIDEHIALPGIHLDDGDAASLQAVLDRGQPPQGDIWSHERGLV
jgi:hypothetical protein